MNLFTDLKNPIEKKPVKKALLAGFARFILKFNHRLFLFLCHPATLIILKGWSKWEKIAIKFMVIIFTYKLFF